MFHAEEVAVFADVHAQARCHVCGPGHLDGGERTQLQKIEVIIVLQ